MSKPIGRILVWRGGSNRNPMYGTYLTIRSYEELPTSSTYPENQGSPWKEGAPVYAEPQAAEPQTVEDKLSATQVPEGYLHRYATEEEYAAYKKNPNILLKIAGVTQRCDCGSNVVHHPTRDFNLFRCNGCGANFYTWSNNS